MKIAFTTTGDDTAAAMDARFGRAGRFLIYDTENGTAITIDNRQNLNAAQGAGIQAAETVVKSGAQALVTGHCGPKAFRVLAASGVAVYTTDAATIAEALAKFQDGSLARSESADVQGHW
jgi:predicted Fe-Mo cluster-binding NifX family protein